MHFRCLLVLAGACALAGAGSAAAARPLQTAVYVQPSDLKSGKPALVFQRVRAAGATAVRLSVSWRDVAPAVRPPGFHPDDPAAPGYDWALADQEISLAKANGLEPLVTVVWAPSWAEQGPRSHATGNKRVSPKDFGLFAKAIARRYSGSFQGLPRVRYWLAWNEPNISKYLSPQVSGGELVGAARYRKMVNAFAASVHGVHSDNVVVAGLLSPFTYKSDPGPLRFMRAFLCMSKASRPKPTCHDRVHFDVWSAHPYTSGGPTHHAFRPDDVSIGDLPRVRRLLDAAAKAHHVLSGSRVRFWVTEFSWDSKPPDSLGVPATLEAQWIAQGLYTMWRDGVGLVTWFQLRDEARPSPFQSGLYYRGSSLASAKPKPGLTAFRFPFVAFRRKAGTFVWARTPGGIPASVSIELSSKKNWKRVTTVRTNAYGILSKRLAMHAPGTSSMRATLAGPGGVRSFPFPLTPPRDRFVLPFGR